MRTHKRITRFRVVVMSHLLNLREVFPLLRYAGVPLALLACLSAGCRRSPPPTLAFIPRMTADDVWEPSHAGALQVVRGSGYRLYWNGPPNEQDVQGQISLLDAVIARGYRGIILAPDQSLALMMPVENALRRGIPTVILSSPLPLRAKGKLFYVLNDEKEAGRLAALRIGQQLHGRGQVAVLGIDPEATGMVERVQAFDATLELEYPRIQIVSKRADSQSEAQAEQSTEDMLRAYPHLTGILALTFTETTAALEALQQNGGERRVLLMGCSQRYQLLYYLSQGGLNSLLVENTYQMGREAAHTLIEADAGRQPQSIQFVKPILVTRENMFDPALLPVLTHLGKE